MTNTAPYIVFDPEAYKVKGLEGPFAAKKPLKDVCVIMTSSDQRWGSYQEWATNFGVDSSTGSILTSINNPASLKFRRDGLTVQLVNGNKPYEIPPALKAAFEEAATNASDKPFKALLIANTRWTLFFDLNKSFPSLKLHATCATPNDTEAQTCNNLISTHKPEFSQLVYKSDWQNDRYDLVSIDFAAMYEDRAGLEKLVQNIAQTGACQVVFTNILENTDDKGLAQWWGQRTYGGITPLRLPAKGELTALMNAAGYDLVEQDATSSDFPINSESALNAKPRDEWKSFSYIRKPTLA